MSLFGSKTVSLHDDYTTPYSAWEQIKDYIPKDKTVWESFYCNGSSGEYLTKLGFTTIHREVDFFTNDLGDIIVSNPPFSRKKEVLERLKTLDKPFIMLMPASVLHTKYLRTLFPEGIQIIVPPKRIQFGKYKEGKLTYENKCNFDCLYYCYKMDLPSSVVLLK